MQPLTPPLTSEIVETARHVGDMHRPLGPPDEHAVQWCASSSHRTVITPWPCSQSRWATAILAAVERSTRRCLHGPDRTGARPV
jgi:hypothetical protein